MCYLKQPIARVPHPEMRQSSHGSAPPYSKAQRWTSPLPPLTHHALVFKKIVAVRHFEKVIVGLIVRSHLRSKLCANGHIWLQTENTSFKEMS